MTEEETPMECLIKSLVTMVQVIVIATLLGVFFGASAVFAYKGTLVAIDEFGFTPVCVAAFVTFGFLAAAVQEWKESRCKQSDAQHSRGEGPAENDNRPTKDEN